MPHRLFLWPLILSGCLGSGVREDLSHLEAQVDEAPAAAPRQDAAQRPAEGKGTEPPRQEAERTASAPPAASPPATPPAEPQPANEDYLELNQLIAEALRTHPEVLESAARARAAAENVRSAGALDDPTFKVETEAVPLEHPLAFDRADDNMFGLSQSFPFPGNLAKRAEAALYSAQAQGELHRATRSQLIASVKAAYYEYFLLVKEFTIHTDHARLLEEFVRITEARFRSGIGLQQDVLKAQVELVMLHNDVIELERQLRSVQAVINSFVGRPMNQPLALPREIQPLTGRVDFEAFLEKAAESRPELRAAHLRASSARSALDLATREAFLPNFMIGADYWQVDEGDDAWGGFVAISLPWLTGKRLAEKRRMAHELRAEELAEQSATRRAYLELRDAFLRFEAAGTSVILVQGELLPKSRQSVEVSRSSYENGRSTFLELVAAERALRDVEIAFYRALAAQQAAFSELERAAGTNLEVQP
jgi:cobalt-zinc-cadmium efflux system outer membrane protein